MKILLLISFLFSSSLWAVNGQEVWKEATLENKIRILEGYKEFFRTHTELKLGEFTPKQVTFIKLFFNDAWAAGNYDCIYAGWPSVRIGGSCSSPQRNNAEYDQGTCGKGEMHCQPLLFGKGLCAPVATRAQKNSAFSSCDRKFKASGRSSADVVKEIEADKKQSTFTELMDYADKVCASGKQSGTAMCRKLENTLKSLRGITLTPEAPKTPDAPVEPPKEEKDATEEKSETEVATETPQVTADSRTLPPITDVPPKTEKSDVRVAVENVARIPQVVASVNDVNCPENTTAMNRAVITKDPKVPVLVCDPGKTQISAADEDALIKALNLSFHPSEAAVRGTSDFKDFILEINKFPRPLLQELSDSGAQMRLIVGQGVTSDPQWEIERQKSLESVRSAWDFYNRNGGTRPSMTEADVNRNYSETVEGERGWKYVAGAGGVNVDRRSIKPTRIVINHLYKSFNEKGELQNAGTVNLVLHEHGHALDSLYGSHSISESPRWKELIADPKTKAYLDKILSSYETNYPGENFAELFAYYHSCDASRNQMETEAPALADFFKNLKSVKEFRPDLYESWKKRG